MSLNIKNPRVHELAKEAARRFGMSQTSVIEEALVRLIAAHEAEAADSAEARMARALEILSDIDRLLTPDQRRLLARGADDLYDEETGLPA